MKLLVPLVLVAAVACKSSAAAPTPLPAFFENGDVRLAFTLDLPSGPGPFPAVVMGHGSGKTTRDHEGLDHGLSPAVWEDIGRWLQTLTGRTPSKNQ
jgi:hypothetical protein